MTVKNRPTGMAAKEILSKFWNTVVKNPSKAMKVIIEDSNDKVKTVGIDLRMADVLNNIFIAQALFENFETPMAMCEGNIRGDLIEQMKQALST